MQALFNQLFYLLFVVLVFSAVLGVVFYTFSRDIQLKDSNFNAISQLIILFVVSFLLGFLYYLLSFPFNSLYLLNGFLVHVLFYDQFMKAFAFKKHLALLLIAILYFSSIIVSIIVCTSINDPSFSFLLTNLPSSFTLYWQSIQSNTDDYLEFLMQLFGLFIALRGV